MSRPVLEVADIFRQHGEPYRQSHPGQLSWDQLKVMSAIERCRTPVLGGHVLQCPSCEHVHIAYNSCRIRHVGLFANACRKNAVRQIRHALAAQENRALPEITDAQEKQACDDFFYRCPACGATLVIIDILAQGAKPRAPPGIRLASCA